MRRFDELPREQRGAALRLCAVVLLGLGCAMVRRKRRPLLHALASAAAGVLAASLVHAEYEYDVYELLRGLP